MTEPNFRPSAHPGYLHHYAPKLVAFEYATPDGSTPENTLLFVGGLGDGLRTVPYVKRLSKTLNSKWRVVEVLLTSSYFGWGVSSLVQDVQELSSCVEYFRQLGHNKIVLMGHSTGSQDCIEYVVGTADTPRPKLDGVILQAGVSDRECLVQMMGDEWYEKAVDKVRKMIEAGDGGEIVPLSVSGNLLGTAIKADRMYSLLSPPPEHDGKDDFFSSNLTDSQLAKTFGRWAQATYTVNEQGGPPMLILYGGADQYVPKEIDKVELVEKWTAIVKSTNGSIDDVNGGVVPGATHTLAGCSDEVLSDLANRVSLFLARIDTVST